MRTFWIQISYECMMYDMRCELCGMCLRHSIFKIENTMSRMIKMCIDLGFDYKEVSNFIDISELYR